jgi:hypothetical protein
MKKREGGPVYYACGICGHNHPWDWDADCRDDTNRFTDEQLETKHPKGFELRDMSERVEADNLKGRHHAARRRNSNAHR